MKFPVAALLLSLLALTARAEVVVNEIMYHPQSENIGEEYIELYNSGAAAADLSNWRFTSGVAFIFPAGSSIAANGYLVVTASPATFQAKYPAVANYVASGGWAGQLSNSANKITLEDNIGTKRDEVSYSDDGDWAERRRDNPPDFGHRGWDWRSDADGFGKSLELINPVFDNNTGQNWTASTTAQGTPGAPNSVAAPNIAPVIFDGAHFPLVPSSADNVTITCRVVDDQAAAVTVQLHYRNDGAASFTTAQMFDDGAHGDAQANDGVFGTTIAPKASGTIVEFYFTATEAGALTRTWPAPARDYTGALVQSQNCLYQVDDTIYAGAMPIYRIILRAADKTELNNINTDTGTPPFPFNAGETSDQTYSHAKFNTTFISVDGTGTKLRYLTGARNRGNGSRSLQPQSMAMAFQNGQPWNGLTAVNLNTQKTPYQLLGSALVRKSGLAMAESRAVQVRVNATNPASGTGSPAYGFYVCNEANDSVFAEHHFPLDSSGNLYRGQRVFRGTTAGGTTVHGADLGYITPAAGETQSQVDLYKLNYFKRTNSSEDQWGDLIGLTQALAKGHSGATPAAPVTYDADYVSAVQARADVAEWMRFLAVNIFADNSETNITMGDGDDFYLYFGVVDPRAKFVSYDLDTILGSSATSNLTTHSIFRMVTSDESGNPPTPLNAFVKHPEFAPIYYAELKRLLDGPFNPTQFEPLVDEVLGGVVPTVINSIKAFNVARHAYITSQVPLAIAVTSGPAALNGYPHTTTATTGLSGVANAINTRSVKLNGVAATWTQWSATWSAGNVLLRPGINKVLIQAFDASNAEIERLTYDVWYDDASVATASGTLASNTTWTAAGGPYRVTTNLVVPNGITLTIQPGTTVYVASGATIQVNGTGKISAVGTDAQRIVFAKEPSATGNWGSLDFINTTVESTLSYVSFSDCGGTTIGGHNAQVHANNAIVFFDHLYFPPTPVIEYISFDAASFIVQQSYFSTYSGTTGPESLHGVNGIMAGGRGIFRDNYFGHTYGFNDTIDYTGGNRPGPILQFIGNVFDGASDDHLDLDSTDAWIEGNVFMHAHRDPSRTDDARDTSSAISGGTDTAGVYNEWTIINNIFYDVDHVFMTKQGGRVAFIHNTVSHVAKENGAGLPADIAFINWTDNGIALAPASAGAGAYVAHNIVHDSAVLQANYDPANQTVIMDNNILPVPWTGAGSGNQVVDPRLNLSVLEGTPVASVTAGQLRQAFQLLPGSPAIGTGLAGRNLGGLGAHGMAVFGEPSGTTNSTSATLFVAPGGTMNWGTIPPFAWSWTAFKWKLDNGPWSAEIAVNNPPPFNTPASINLTGLANGTHTVYVTGKNDVGYYQDDTFLYPTTSSVPAAVTASRTWTVDTSYVAPPAQPLVRINEVLAKNSETQGFSGVFPDIIELQNAGGATADISGWGLTDSSLIPFKYTFPASTTIAPGAYLIVYASSSASVPVPKTGFALKDAGDTLTLTKSAAAGGGIADSVAFGAQLADYSAGRRTSDAAWDLCKPSFGSANVVAAQAALGSVKINEWLADAAVVAAQDFIELMNTGTLPVNIGNAYLTDNPSDWPQRHQIRQLTFIAPSGYVRFKADADPGQGPDHLSFKLDALQGEIGLFSPSLALVDNIVYGPQSTDVSQGRTPNGTSTIAFFTQPTPGGPNPGVTGTTSSTVSLIPATQPWKYYGTTAAPLNDTNGRPFTDPLYLDSSWSSGAQLLYIETAALTNTEGFLKTTVLPGITTTKPYQTYYFRTHFNFSGQVTGTTLTAKMMVDDGCILYLNGQELIPTSGSRIGMNTGAVSYSTLSSRNVSDAAVETFTFPASALVVGDNVLSVEVHQAADQSSASPSSDISWGFKLDSTVTSAGGAGALVLNEVLPINATTQNPDGSFTGWIELYNPSAASITLADASLSDDPAAPRKFVFPAGASIAPGGYAVVFCNPLAPASATNTGFALPRDGGSVFLFEPLSGGGGLHDAVSYGRQIPDFSIGRTSNGAGPFALCVPTRGTLNTAAGIAPLSSVKINEWLANPSSGADFFELYNSGSQPVALGGNYFTDLLTNKTKQVIPALSFIGGSGTARWQVWTADNDSSGSPGHVSFTLDNGEALGLFTAGGVALDTQALGSAATGESRGRFPDGTSAILALVPTPGNANSQQIPGDTDGDGIPDTWESANGLNPNDPRDAALDLDGDGQSNKAEYLAGTNPQSSASRLAASLVSTATPGQFAVRFTAIAGKSYTVRYKNDLTATMWTKLLDVSAQGSDTLLDVTDPGSAAQPRRFYQVVTPAQP